MNQRNDELRHDQRSNPADQVLVICSSMCAWETETANPGDTRGGEIRARPARDTDEETANIYAA